MFCWDSLEPSTTPHIAKLPPIPQAEIMGRFHPGFVAISQGMQHRQPRSFGNLRASYFVGGYRHKRQPSSQSARSARKLRSRRARPEEARSAWRFLPLHRPILLPLRTGFARQGREQFRRKPFRFPLRDGRESTREFGLVSRSSTKQHTKPWGPTKVRWLLRKSE